MENTLWQAEKVILPDGTTVAFDPWRSATIFFENGEAGGRTPCNFFNAGYTIDDPALELSDPEITNAGCANDTLSVQERVFIDKLFSAEIFSITGDELTLIYPGGSFVFLAKPQTKGNEAAVFSAVLREWQDADKPQFVLIKDTAFNAPGISLDETLTSVQTQLVSLGSDSPKLTPPRCRISNKRTRHQLPWMVNFQKTLRFSLYPMISIQNVCRRRSR
ncbi:MAG: META domain-containing protein [Anaerolineae bacterium]|nr:META domain-containing protein [Anaerolineae bacterium]